MKIEEAINELSRMKRTVNFQSRIAGSGGVEIFIDNDYRDDFISTMDLSIKALNKQVEQKPIPLINPGGKDVILCGECEKELKGNWKGCPHCLTVIDWSEE